MKPEAERERLASWSVARVRCSAEREGAGPSICQCAARQRNKPVSKARRLRHALSRMIDEPHKVAKSEPTVAEKILAAAGTAAATMLVKKMMEKAFNAAGQEARSVRT